MVEATLGTILLLFAALVAGQLVLVFHGALAGHSAAARAARTYAITGQQESARETFALQVQTALGVLDWQMENCSSNGDLAECTVTVNIPAIVPAGGLFGEGGLQGPISLSMRGYYPIGERSGG